VDQCARYGLAPAVGTGLAAQHICRRRVEEARPARAARRAPPGRACHAGARARGARVCSAIRPAAPVGSRMRAVLMWCMQHLSRMRGSCLAQPYTILTLHYITNPIPHH